MSPQLIDSAKEYANLAVKTYAKGKNNRLDTYDITSDEDVIK